MTGRRPHRDGGAGGANLGGGQNQQREGVAELKTWRDDWDESLVRLEGARGEFARILVD